MAPFIKASLKKNKENSNKKYEYEETWVEEPVFFDETLKDALNSPSF